MKRSLPHETDQKYLVFAATGTDLIFNRGVELPGFASFPLNEDPKTQPVIVEQMRDLVRTAQEFGMGCIIDTLTWMANRDRAAPLGYDTERLTAVNRQAVRLMRDLRDEIAAEDVLLALCIGPSRDPYVKLDPLGTQEARRYHYMQMESVHDMGLDLVHAFTFNQVEEAAGAVLAARDLNLPIVLSLVVETDGCLDDGTPLNDAISAIDELSGHGAAYFMVNCAHPDHFRDALTGNPRLRGVVVNASRCSHAELDNATELDAGNPQELAEQIAQIVETNPDICVVGGCCGTDMRHLREMAKGLTQ